MSNPHQNEHEPNAANFPVPVPSATALIRRTQSALELLRDVVQESSAEYWYERGKEAKEIKNWLESSANFRSCIVRDNHNWRAMLQLAATIIHQQKEEAAALILQAHDLYPDRYNYEYDNIFTQELSNSEWQLLQDEFKNYHSPQVCELGIRLALAIVSCVLKDLEFAYQAMQEMTLLYPKQVEQSAAWHSISGVLWSDIRYSSDEKRYQKSLTDHDRAIELDPNYSAAYCKRADAILFSTGWLKENLIAIDNYNYAIELDPDYAAAYYKRGYAKNHIGNLPDAIIDYSQAIRLDSKFISAFYGRGRANAELHNYSEALSDYRSAIQLEKSDSFWGKFIPSVTLEKRHTVGILLIYELLVELRPNSASSYSFRADIKLFFGDKIGAIADRQKAKQLSAK